MAEHKCWPMGQKWSAVLGLVVRHTFLPFLLSGMQTRWLEPQQSLRTMKWKLPAKDNNAERHGEPKCFTLWMCHICHGPSMYLQTSFIWNRKKSPCISHYFFLFCYAQLKLTFSDAPPRDEFVKMSSDPIYSLWLPFNWSKDGAKINNKKITSE